LFAHDARALSHGCIRVEAPEALAAAVLSGESWSVETINAAIDTGAQQTVALGAPLPVYLLYITASPNEAGEIAYADDVYGRDAAVVAALDGPDAALGRQAATAPVRCPVAPSMP
jgi:murein L,D-transpeptidase YcbB/YkuD